MRPQTAGEETLLAGANYAVFQRVRVINGSGSVVDYSDWVERISIDSDIDQPTDQATIEFRRDASPTLSLAPFRTDSTLNRLDDGVTYSPALDANRLISIDVAAVAIGSTPAAGDWNEVFKGYIASVDAATPSVKVVAQDLGRTLVRRWIKTEKAYGYDQPIETVMQQIIDDTLGAGVVTLNVVGSPAFNIITYEQQSEPLMSALRTLAQERAWDVRYKWDEASSTFKLTLFEPDRTKTVPDRTFGPSSYFDVTRLEISDLEVRNYLTLSFINSVNGYAREEMVASDATSISRYGEQFFGLTLSDASTIDTQAEASLLLGNILLDLKDPKAEVEIEAQFFWPVELGDLYRFSDNDVHFNTDQDWAVTGFRHDLYGGTGRTYLRVRGKPAGGFLSWLVWGRQSEPGGLSPGDAADIEGWIQVESDHAVGTASQGWSEEGRLRGGNGGYTIPDALIHGIPVYDSTGARPLVNTLTEKITTDLKYPTGTGVAALEPAEPGAEVTTGKSLTVLADRTAANINYVAGGVSVESLKPAEAGAEVTTGKSLTVLADRTAANINYVAGGVSVESLKPQEAGANVTETRTSADTAAVAGDAAATVKDGSARARAGLAVTTGLVAAPVPRVHAIANVPGIDATTGQVDKATAFDTGELQAGLRDTTAAAGIAAQGWSEEGRIRGGDGGFAIPGALIHSIPVYDSTGASVLLDPTAETFTGKKIIGSGTGPTVGTGLAPNQLGTGYTLTVAGKDTAGTVTLTTGAAPITVGIGAGTTIFSVTFGTPYSATPHGVVSPANEKAANFGGGPTVHYPTMTTTTVSISTGLASAGLDANTVYKWTYVVIG